MTHIAGPFLLCPINLFRTTCEIISRQNVNTVYLLRCEERKIKKESRRKNERNKQDGKKEKRRKEKACFFEN